MREEFENAEERNYSKQALSAAEVERIVKAVGGVAQVINTRHAIAKANGWKDKPPSRAAFAAAAATENNLLRRPVILRGADGIVSRDLDAIRAFLK